MDLDVADISMGSLLRRVGDTDLPLSNPSSASPQQRRRRRGRPRRASPQVRATLLRLSATGQRRPTAGTSIKQFILDQELAFDASVDSVDLNMSGSPTTRARSFLAHQRRSLSGDELATLMRELRTPASRSGRRRLSVIVSQRHLAALGDDGVQALLELFDDGLEEFEGTMSASMAEENDTLTSSLALVAGAEADEEGEHSRQEDPPGGGDGVNTVMEESAGGAASDGQQGTQQDGDKDRTGAEGELDEVTLGQDVETMDEGDPEQAVSREHDFESADIETSGNQRTSAFQKEGVTRSMDRSHLRRTSSDVPVQTPEVGTPTPRSPIRRTPSSVVQRGALPSDVVTPSSGGRGRLSRSRNTPGSLNSGASAHQTPAADRTLVGSKDGSVTPASRTPLRATSSRAVTARSVGDGGTQPSGSGKKSRGRSIGSPSALGSLSLRERSRRSQTPQSVRQRAAAAPGPSSDDIQLAGSDADDMPYDAHTAFDTPVLPPLPSAASRGSVGRVRSALATPQTGATPRGSSVRKNYGPAFERFFADNQRGQTSTPRSEPPRRRAGAVQFSPHSKSMYVAAVPRHGKTPGRLSLALDDDEQPLGPFTSGVIDDPDEVGSDVSEEFPSEAGAAAGGSGQLSRASGTPFVPSAESTRLSLRPAGAPLLSRTSAGSSSGTEIYDAAATGPSARSPAAVSVGTPAQHRSRTASFADGTARGQEQPSPAATTSQSRLESAPSRTAVSGRLSAREAFARLFPNYERDSEKRREEAAAIRRRSPTVPKRKKRPSLVGRHKTRRWFRQNAVGLRVTHEALHEVDVAMEKFERMVYGWLREVTGKGRAPTQSDALAVLRRSGIAGTEPELRRLIRRHMMLEEQQELIRVAESGNRLYPAYNPLAED